MRLFIAHSCRYQGKLLNELKKVGKKIAKACNDLPLSLKVMGAFLRKKIGWDVGNEFYKG